MAIGLLGGHLKGHLLDVPKGDIIRPTLATLKRKLFDSHQDWSEEVFVDICAGSGSMGMEAWSRGATYVELVEFQSKVIKVLDQNIKKLQEKAKGELGELHLVELDAKKYLKILPERLVQLSQKGEVTLYFDPPYPEHKLYQALMEQIENFKNTCPFRLIIESDTEKGPKKELFKPLDEHLVKEYCQGSSYLLIYKF